jgi:hypothetical protein
VTADDAGAVAALAERYAPIVVTKDQAAACDTNGEPFRPVPVDVVLGRGEVVLRAADGNVLVTAPTAADLFDAPADAYLDFPGNSLEPGCDYEQWFDEIAAGVPTTVYAHVLTETGHPEELALQYWFYWVYNDWNNKHESDWEMIQLVFPVGSAAEALDVEPTEVGYAQHEGAERASWDADKLDRRGEAPLVFPGARSHAGYFTSHLFLGHSAAEGFGCDDTRGPSTETPAEIIVLPDAPSGRDDPTAWLAFEGRWGQKESGPNNGPTGPAAKDRWAAPMTWADDEWRDDAVTVPASSGIAPTATGFFCSAVARGSEIYLQLLLDPIVTLAALGLLVAAVVFAVRRTEWSPAPAEPVDARRRSGELFRSAWRLYRQRPSLYLAVGLVFVPVGVVVTLLQQLIFEVTPLGALADVATEDPLVGVVGALTVGSISTILATVFVQAATTAAVDDIDHGFPPSARGSYAAAFHRAGDLWGVTWRPLVVAVLLSLTIVGIPLAILYVVRRSVAAQGAMLEDVDAPHALDRSRQLVAPRTWRTFVVTTASNVACLVLGPLLGVVVLLVWSPALRVVNLVSSIVYVALIPYAGLVLALLFYDLRARSTAKAEA